MRGAAVAAEQAGRWQAIVLIGIAAVLSQGFLPVGRFLGAVDTTEVGVSDPWANALQGFVLLGIVGLGFRHRRRVLPLCRAARSLALPWIYCACSALWSDNPGTTLRHALLLLAYLGFGPVAVALRGTGGTIRLLRLASLMLLACSVLLFVAVPEVGADVGPYAGALRGVFVQKNVTAWAFELALCYVGYDVLATGRFRATHLAQIALFAGAIVLTRSTTELLSAVALLGFWVFVLWWERARTRLLPMTVAVAVVGVVGLTLALLGNDAFSLIGKDPTLTGRDIIWQAARNLIADRPLLGYGFQGFWLPGDRTVEQIWAELDWKAPHAHNGVLELLVEVGFVGAAFAAALLIRLLTSAVRAIRHGGRAFGWWTLSWLMLVAIKGMAEPVYFTLDMATALLSFSLVGLAMDSEATSKARAAGPLGIASAARARRWPHAWAVQRV